MKKFRRSFSFVVGLLAVVGLFGCSQETPTEKTKATAPSGNAVTEAVGQAAVDYAKTPMDKARQTEGIFWSSRLSRQPLRSRNRRHRARAAHGRKRRQEPLFELTAVSFGEYDY